MEEVATHSCLEVEVYIDDNIDQIIGSVKAILGQQLGPHSIHLLNPILY
jgi:hypothetical protein